MAQIQETKSSTVKLFNRQLLEIDGVSGVLSFEKDFLSIRTSSGDLDVEGNNLVIEDLSKTTSKIIVKGEINAILYHLDSKKKKGLW